MPGALHASLGMSDKRFVYILRSDIEPNRHYTGITSDVGQVGRHGVRLNMARMVRFYRTGMLALLFVAFGVPAFAQVGHLWTPQELTAKELQVVTGLATTLIALITIDTHQVANASSVARGRSIDPARRHLAYLKPLTSSKSVPLVSILVTST